MEARRLVITGVVQGVGFRYHMIRMAQRLGLVGWVRNRRDGSVEAVVAGDPEPLTAMIHWTRQGPPAALVEQVFVEQIEEAVAFENFHQGETE